MPEPYNVLRLDEIVILTNFSNLETNKHDDVRFPFLGFVSFYAGVHQSDEFLKYCLLDDDSLVKPWDREENEIYFLVLIH